MVLKTIRICHEDLHGPENRKTSEFERSHIFTSKLYPTFFLNSDFFRVQKICGQHFRKNIIEKSPTESENCRSKISNFKNRFAWILYQISKEFHLISSCRAPDHEKSEKCDFFRTEIWHPNFPKNIGHWKLVKTHQYQPLQTRTASRTNFLYGASFFLGSAVSKISNIL